MMLFQNHIDTYSNKVVRQFNNDRQEYLDQLMLQVLPRNEVVKWIQVLRQHFTSQQLSIGRIANMVEDTRICKGQGWGG